MAYFVWCYKSFSNVTFVNVQGVHEIFLYKVFRKIQSFWNSALFCNWGGVYVLCAKTTSKIFSEAEKFNFWSQQIKKILWRWILKGSTLDIFSNFGIFSDLSSLKCIFASFVCDFWPKLEVFDQVCTFFSGKIIFLYLFYVVAC